MGRGAVRGVWEMGGEECEGDGRREVCGRWEVRGVKEMGGEGYVGDGT